MVNTIKAEGGTFSIEKTEALNQLLHACIDEMCGYPGPKFEQYKEDTNWHQTEFYIIYKYLSNLLKNPITLYLDKEKMPAEYHQLPGFVQSLVMTCLKVRREQIIDAMIRDISRSDCPTVSDFHWKVKYVMGCDKMASIRIPLLQLDLQLKDKQVNRELNLEMNKTELDLLITKLESAI